MGAAAKASTTTHPPMSGDATNERKLPMTQNTQQDGSQPLLSLRSAMVLLLGVLVATGAGIATYLSERSLPAATLAAGAGFGAGEMFFHTIIS